MRKKPLMLIILDGYGIGEKKDSNAAFLAKTPILDELFENYPLSTLSASGSSVGLPDGQMGNSEVGHLNIGSGRIIYQDLTRISKSIEDGEFFQNEILLKAMQEAKKNGTALHLIGLLSQGGVHSHRDHLYGLLEMAKEEGLEKVYIHAIMDGRDVSPDAGLKDMKDLEEKIAEIGVGAVATVSGRYYAMDRDRRWERTKLAYDAFVCGIGNRATDPCQAIEESYKNAIFDEFILPTVICKDGEPVGKIGTDDSLIFFNFRPDRVRQIVRTFAEDEFNNFPIAENFKGYIATMTQYDVTIPNVYVAFQETIPNNTLGEYLSKQGLSQLRIAETEKYAHVTFFFNGGVEVPYENEDRLLIASPKVATYDLMPEMSAIEVTDNVIDAIKKEKYDFIVLNFANCDMVGHTGMMEAAIKAVETVDCSLGKILKVLKEKDGCALITADHGNCEEMFDEEGRAITSHTTNLVPLILYNFEASLDSGILADLAPTILELLELEKPVEMTGRSLILGGSNELNK